MQLAGARYTSATPTSLAEGWSLERLTPPSRRFGANGLRTGPGRPHLCGRGGRQPDQRAQRRDRIVRPGPFVRAPGHVNPGVPGAGPRFDLSGRIALVTGASSGLGEGLARGLASAGARVAVLARRHDRLVKLADEIGGMAVACDLLDLARIGEIVPRIAGELGGPEILVNAAGNLFTREPAEREPLGAIRQTLDLNLTAPFRLAQEVFPHMLPAGRGSIERSRAWLRRNTPLPYQGTVEDFVGAVLWLASDAGRYVTGQTIVVDGGWAAR